MIDNRIQRRVEQLEAQNKAHRAEITRLRKALLPFAVAASSGPVRLAINTDTTLELYARAPNARMYDIDPNDYVQAALAYALTEPLIRDRLKDFT